MIWHRHVQSTHLCDAKDITQFLNIKSRSLGRVVILPRFYRYLHRGLTGGALVRRSCVEGPAYPGVGQPLSLLRYLVRRETLPGLGCLPFVTVQVCLDSFRPPDELLLTAKGF